MLRLIDVNTYNNFETATIAIICSWEDIKNITHYPFKLYIYDAEYNQPEDVPAQEYISCKIEIKENGTYRTDHFKILGSVYNDYNSFPIYPAYGTSVKTERHDVDRIIEHEKKRHKFIPSGLIRAIKTNKSPDSENGWIVSRNIYSMYGKLGNEAKKYRIIYLRGESINV